MNKKKRILICPLDWGLGHASRCIPVINLLLKKDYEVIIAADNGPLEFLKLEYPYLEFITMPGYEINYPKAGSMTLKMLIESKKILKGIKREYHQLDQLIDDYNIDLVISDNRYGLWTRKVPCVFMTHQLYIQAPFASYILKKFTHKYISRYNLCWVPDHKLEPSLSGDLSHSKSPIASNIKFVGPLSRFQHEIPSEQEYKYDLMVIISGPEPQRSVFEEIMLNELSNSNYRTIVLRGLPGDSILPTIASPNIEIHNHLATEEFLTHFKKSKWIISRPGYTTLMDLAQLNKKAVFVPTPGQTEQEYLARFHKRKNHYFYMKQDDFDLSDALNEIENYTGVHIQNDRRLEESMEQIDLLLKQ